MRRGQSFGHAFVRCVGWVAVGFAVMVVALSLFGRHDEPAPSLPSSTDGICSVEDSSPEWWADLDCTGSDRESELPATPLPSATAPAEDSAGFDCAINGNHVCGPGSQHKAGCYRDGVLVIPWTNFEHPRLDPLWAKREPPC